MKRGAYFSRNGFEGIACGNLSEKDLDKILDRISRLTREARMHRLLNMPVDTDEQYEKLAEMFSEDE